MTAIKIANWIMIPALLLSVAVQYNDPDPLRWMTIYGAAAIACWLWLSRRLPWLFSALIGTIALVWAATIIPHLIGKQIPMNEVFGHMSMASEAVEEAREMGGLLIVAAWMIVLTYMARARRAAVTTRRS